MPSAVTNQDKMTSTEAETALKQCITIVEKKLRNLEKRKSKLDVYREKESLGEELIKDQKEAITKYDTVLQNLEFVRDLQKQFQTICAEQEKIAKKLAKREKQEKQQQEMVRLKDVLRLHTLLDNLGTEAVRDDFLQGKQTGLMLSEEDLDRLDQFYQLIVPVRSDEQSLDEQLSHSAEHVLGYLDRLDKSVVGTTYKDLRTLLDRIAESGYFDSSTSPVVEPEQPVEQPVVEKPESSLDDELANQVNSVSLSEMIGREAPVNVDSYQWHHQSMLLSGQSNTTPPNVAMTTVNNYPGLQQPASFANVPYGRQRPLQEIVSSMQGNYNFLQESQIDSDHGAGMVLPGGTGQSAFLYDDTNTATQYTHQYNQSSLNAPPQAVTMETNRHFTEQHLFSQPTSTTYARAPVPNVYGVVPDQAGYNANPQNFGMTSKAPFTFITEPAAAYMSQGHVSTSTIGQSTTDESAFTKLEESAEQRAKKSFTMNPNADIFKSVSVYNQETSSEQAPATNTQQTAKTFTTQTTNYQVDGCVAEFEGSTKDNSAMRSSSSRGGRADKENINNGYQRGGAARTYPGRGGAPNSYGGNYPRGNGRGGRGGQSRGSYRGMTSHGGRSEQTSA